MNESLITWIHLPAGFGCNEFWMAETPITESQWYAVMGGEPPVNTDYPKVNITVLEAENFCAKLSEQMGVQVSLPTDAQFCRALGAEPPDLENYAVFGQREITAVKTRLPNEYGIYDLRGMVGEWLADGGDEVRYLRGGSWYNYQANARAVYRYIGNPNYRDSLVGFRVVLVMRPPAPK